ncbi:monovalent cation:proton antiporter-2 (CPA2) family protein [Vibrio sp. CAU 1672]|uniref:monovalent cation:proton antiporter-2 (CPA2) family protein n=1 Tax=Vibrio sp. CAU 1672 TaxID=3032594 RepID=UPI0023DC03EA|nr:monovalent cation:proton antiporter-2 (CPA2) family protein [Vibrio sp. CAU 1672]MDF2152661.1 monovalent cation:proton antiporter-2 (CPA2) family protein [Vibrio sp. CAU 1672]
MDKSLPVNSGYLVDIIILLLAAVIAVPVFQYLKFGAIPGFLVAGAMIGPSGLGYIQDYDEVAQLAEFGVILLLFIIGMEIKPSSLWHIRRLVLGLGAAQVLITGGIITVVAHEILDASWEASLLIGLSLSLSSTAFVLQLLSERHMLSSEYGRASVAVLLLQDLAVVPLLVFVTFMAEPEFTIVEDISLVLAEAFIILCFIIVFTRYILTPLLNLLSRFGSPEIFTASALLLVLGAAYAMERIGLSMAMGAFVAGLLIADSSYRHQIIAEVQPFRGLLLGLFFMSMGMSLNIVHFLEYPLVLVGVAVTLMTLKFLILWPLSRVFGIKAQASVAVAILLSQSGEFALVLFAVAKSLAVLEEVLFQHLLIVVLLTMLITPVLDKVAYRVFSASRRPPVTMQYADVGKHQQHTQPVIIVGFGRMGHRIGHIMELMKVPYLAIDSDESLVARERSKGKPVYFGDVQSLQVLRAVGATNAPFVIVAINDPGVTEKIVASLHSSAPEIAIFARGHDLIKCHDLRSLGAYYTVSETLEASAELAHAALLHIGVEASEIAIALEQFRKDYYKQVNRNEDQ